MRILKMSIISVTLLSIISASVYFGFSNELEQDILIPQEQEYLEFEIDNKIMKYEVKEIEGVKFIKWGKHDLVNTLVNVEDIGTVNEKLVIRKATFELKSELTSLYNEIGVYDQKVKPLVIVPIFTGSAYAPLGFYDYYEKQCDKKCLTTKIISTDELNSTSSANAVKILKLLGYDSITDLELHQNPNILNNYEKIILLHNEYVTKIMFDALTSHQNVIYLYPNALYAEIEVDVNDNEITLIRGHGFPTKNIDNGFDWEFDNTRPYEYDKKCDNWKFFDIPNGKMLNCYPEQKIWKSSSLLKALKEL
jgi:hypothetical protein|tara:strand:+ start:114 stop:1034 length:921 start_codon:yes stop_codon:yes gene_type:complete